MTTYYVHWDIHIEAETPEAAAKKAWEAMRAPDSIANCFNVMISGGDESVYIDLSNLPPREKFTITWRDENYGRDAVPHAFRIYDMPLDREPHLRVLELIEAAGFRYNGSRSAFVSHDDDAPARLMGLLTAEFEVRQSGSKEVTA